MTRPAGTRSGTTRKPTIPSPARCGQGRPGHGVTSTGDRCEQTAHPCHPHRSLRIAPAMPSRCATPSEKPGMAVSIEGLTWGGALTPWDAGGPGGSSGLGLAGTADPRLHTVPAWGAALVLLTYICALAALGIRAVRRHDIV